MGVIPINDLLDNPAQPFDTESWIKINLPEASSLKPETLKAVEGFVILWNIFEGSICNTKNKEKMVEAFQRIAKNLPISHKLKKLVDESISFYRLRYVTDQKMNSTFDRLNFRAGDQREHVEDVLKGQATGFSDKMLALLIIAYRIRNNLFHGIKSVNTWDDQAKNISEASRIFSLIIEDGITRRTVAY